MLQSTVRLAVVVTATLAALLLAGGCHGDLAAEDPGLSRSSSSTSSTAGASLSHGLLAHWTFEDRTGTRALDVSGNGRHGVIAGGSFVTSPNGEAMVFGGLADHVSLPDINDPALFGGEAGAVTVSALVKVADPLRPNVICGGCGPMSFFSYGQNGSPRLLSRVTERGTGARHYCYSAKVLRTARWTQVTMVLEGHKGYRFYVDGDLVTRMDDTQVKLFDNGPSFIGKVASSGFVGQMDDLRVWNRALTSKEVATLGQSVNQCGNGTCSATESSTSCPEDCLVLGCTKTNRSRCLDLGGAAGSSWASPTAALGAAGTDNGTTFRRASSTLTVNLPAFRVDSRGLPKDPMVLEIRYKDLREDSVVGYWATRNKKQIKVTSLIRFNGVDPDVMGLRGYGSEKWRVQHALFPRTRWQRVKAVGNGTFRFKLTLQAGSKPLPLDYVALHAVSPGRYATLARLQREAALFSRADKPAGAPVSSVRWFSKPPLEPVYEGTRPSAAEVSRPLVRTAARGELLTMSFSVLSPINLKRVSVSPTRLARGLRKLPGISVYRVVNDLKIWTSYKLWPYQQSKKTCGRMPDRIEPFKETAVEANKAARFWLTLAVPAGATPGNYQGHVTVSNGGGTLMKVPVKVTVLPFALEPYPRGIFLYGDRYVKPLSEKPNKVLDNMAQHLVAPKTSLGYNIAVPVSSRGAGCPAAVCFDLSGLSLELDRLAARGLLPQTHFVSLAYKTANDIMLRLGTTGATVYQKLSDPGFVASYGRFVRQLDALAAARGITFAYSVIDEPNRDLYRRTIADRLYTIIKAQGGKTWVTYSPHAEQILVGRGTYAPTHVTLPSLAALLDYKLYNSGNVTPAAMAADSSKFGYYTTAFSQLRSPIYNRYLVGHFAHRTSAKAIGVYAYGDHVGDPYNDFDKSWHHVAPFHYPDFVLAYPSWDGQVFSTMGYEGLRDGIIDARYVATLQQQLALRPGHAHAPAARAYLSTRFASLPRDWMASYSDTADGYGFEDTILGHLAPSGATPSHAVFGDIRAELTSHIVKLMAP